ncbi:sulfatase [Roseibacillus persicicus]|uniref:Sulfatase n=2 Tax=Roseibacillus persicicus TaxID=454148 RepID=A0A918WH84_9BACT|nr:sulfatase [Roseibacillus persicicus]
MAVTTIPISMKSLFILLLAATSSLWAAERPNILWITSEDNGKEWLGCYGNEQAKTPNLDSFAKRSVQFQNFFSNAPVCAVARSTILTGVYAPSQGSQHMRSRHAIPSNHKPYVSYLREAGYYCSNASKTDFNFIINDKAVWDECDGKAHYRNRAEGQPFFSIFNLTDSHESSLFPDRIAKNRENGHIPPTPRLSPEEVEVPPYLPDLPEIRSDYAVYSDTITHLDRKIGKILSELESQGLADDTIVFYFSDHGGILPRGKRYLKDTGVNVPLLVHVPEKWKALSPFTNGSVTEEKAAFIDLAPTLFSMLGIEIPEIMQGRAILGEKRKPAPEYVFLYADRFDEIYGMRRGLTDGRWKYIRRFTPHLPAAPYSYYQFGQDGWTAWKKAWQEGNLSEELSRIWEPNQEVEELFDTQSDPWEVKNLAQDPAFAEQLKTMREALAGQMATIADTGIIPEPMFPELAKSQPIAAYAHSRIEEWPDLIELAFTATKRDETQLPLLIEKLASKDPLERYWASQGCLILGKKAAPAEEALRVLLADPSSANRVSAAQALVVMDKPAEAYELLLTELNKEGNEYAQQNVVNVLTQLDAHDRIPDEWVIKFSKKKKAGAYVKRLAEMLAEERGL